MECCVGKLSTSCVCENLPGMQVPLLGYTGACWMACLLQSKLQQIWVALDGTPSEAAIVSTLDHPQIVRQIRHVWQVHQRHGPPTLRSRSCLRFGYGWCWSFVSKDVLRCVSLHHCLPPQAAIQINTDTRLSSSGAEILSCTCT